MEVNIPISKENYNKAFMKVLNSLIGHAPSELDVVIEMLNSNTAILNKEVRKEIRGRMNKDEQAFNNLIYELKKRGTLIKRDKSFGLNDTILSGVRDYSIKINFHTT